MLIYRSIIDGLRSIVKYKRVHKYLSHTYSRGRRANTDYRTGESVEWIFGEGGSGLLGKQGFKYENTQ